MPDESSSSSESCVVVLDVFRINGTRVPDGDKAHEGSIVNIYNPYRVDYEELPDPPNNRIDIELSWSGDMPIGSVATLEEHGPSLGKGTIAIYDGNVLVKPARASWVVINLAAYTDPKRFQVEAYLTGVTNLKFVIREYAGGPVVGQCQDDVRISGISDLPKDGRIVFVNPQATTHLQPYDDYETNAASRVTDAVGQLQAEDNIVIAPLRFPEIDLILDKSCVVAGIGGYFDPSIEVTNFNVSSTTLLDANQQGRIFEISTDTADTDSITITGLQANNGKALAGGTLLSERDADASVRLSFCKFEGNEAVDAKDALNLGFPAVLKEASGLAALAEDARRLGFAAARKAPGPAGETTLASGNGGSVSWEKRVKAGTIAADTKTFVATGCKWKGNKAEKTGGAVSVHRRAEPEAPPTVLLLKRELENNSTRFTPLLSRETFFRKCEFEENNAVVQGGAIVARRKFGLSFEAREGFGDHLRPGDMMTGGAPIRVTDCLFDTNSAGPIKFYKNLPIDPYNWGLVHGGGAIYMEGINCSGSIIEGCDFKANTCMSTSAGGQSAGDGGAIAANFMATLTIIPFKPKGEKSKPCTFNGNRAWDGGGAIYCTYFAVMRIIKAEFKFNVSRKGGGAIHATSGCVVDIMKCKLHRNDGGWGGAIFNRNTRMDIRAGTVIEHNLSRKTGGGVELVCQDDSGGTVRVLTDDGVKDVWKFPEAAIYPAILRIHGRSIVRENTAKAAGGGVHIMRWPNRKKSRWVDVMDKVLKIDILTSQIVNNTAGPDPKFATAIPRAVVGGLAMEQPWESKVNQPEFDEGYFMKRLNSAFREFMPYAGTRWPTNEDVGGTGFTAPRAATYIRNIMLWNLTRAKLSDDNIDRSTFSGNKAPAGAGVTVFQDALADPDPKNVVRGKGKGGLVGGGNTIGRGELQQPPGLLK